MQYHHHRYPQRLTQLTHASQQGMVLVIVMLLMLILTMVGVSMARRQTVQQQITTNEQMRTIALEAAEAALRSGEQNIGFSPQEDFANQTGGKFRLDTGGSKVPQNMADTTLTESYTGDNLQNVPTSPRIATEWIGRFATPGQDSGKCNSNCNTPPPDTYQVTAYAVGGDGTASSTVQSVYHQ